MKKSLLILITVFAVIGCSKNTQRKLGITETMPDEYQVKRNNSLEVPPIYQKSSNKIKSQNAELSNAEKSILNKIK